MTRHFSALLAFGGIVLLMVGAIGLGIFAVVGGNAATDIFHFISLLIIFMAALAATALVFFGLRLSNAKEAFGLPTGSIRALIAVGIMILFVVFGVPLATEPSSAPERIADTPLATATVPVESLAAAMDQHEKQGLVVIVSDYGRRAGANAPADPGSPAKIQYYQKIRARSPEELDISKQLLTAIVTLLTTVVGFYFGAQSVSEGVKRTEAARTPDPSTDLSTRLAAQGKSLSSLRAAESGVSQQVDSLRGTIGQGTDDAKKSALAQADTLKGQIDAGLQDLDSKLNAASAALTKLQQATDPTERSELQNDLLQQLQQLDALLAAATDRQQAYAKAAQALQ